MAREKVPFVKWTANDTKSAGRFWVARFANDGAEALADYIKTLRGEYARMKSDGRYGADEMADIAYVGKHAVKVYNRHFGEI